MTPATHHQRRLAWAPVALLIAVQLILPLAARADDAAPVAHQPIQFGEFLPAITDPMAGESVIAGSEAKWQRPVDIVMYYQAWGDHQSDWRTPRVDILQKIAPRTALITWEPWDPSAGPWQTQYAPSAIAHGNYDGYITTWAKALADFGQPVYLRPMHEMNGGWYPWGGALWGNPATDYVAAWRHMHSLFVDAGATNVRWVWSANAQDVPQSNHFEQYYPGSAYVDVLGLDGYNWGSTQWWSHWQSFDDIFRGPYDRITQLGNQPVWVAETASTSQSGDRPAWIRDMWTTAQTLDRLTTIIWFSGDKETDWSI